MSGSGVSVGAGAAEEGTPSKASKPQHNRGTVWVQEGNFVRPVKVRTGLTDGLNTEVVEVLDLVLLGTDRGVLVADGTAPG